VKLFLLILKNLRRSKVRSVLTVLAVIFLVVIFSMILTVLRFLRLATTAQAKDVRTVITERYRIPSRFDEAYMEEIVRPGTGLNRKLAQVPGFHPELNNIWHFIVFSTDADATRRDPNRVFFVIATYPHKIPTMVDSMEGLDPSLPEKMVKPKSGLPNTGIIMGPERLNKLGKRVGDVFKATSLSHQSGKSGRAPIEMEFEIVGTLPEGTRWTNGAFMDYEYLDRVLQQEESDLEGKVNLGWLMVDDQASAAQVGGLIEEHIRDIKNEVGSSAVGRFLENYQSILNGTRYLLAPAIVAVMIAIVANAIGITVRERTTEMAVLKVLGFNRGRIMTLVLGEGVLLGLIGGLIGACATYFLINKVFGGINLRIAFFDVFFVPERVFLWGPLVGVSAAVLGSIVPAWMAQQVKVSEVFAKVT
jgi:putative ABC transport system permease protein